MDPVIGSALIGAGSSLLGGLFSNRSARKQADANTRFQQDFAQKGIQWKVEDAKKAGIHPLYALGASTHSFSPVAINDSMGPAMASAGQDISRAMMAGQRGDTRPDIGEFAQAYELGKLNVQLAQERVRGAQLDNMLKWQDVTGQNRARLLGPGGTGDTQLPPPVPNTYKANPVNPSAAVGTKPATEYYDVGGLHVPLPAGDLKDAELGTLLAMSGLNWIAERTQGGGRELLKQDRRNRPGYTQEWNPGTRQWDWVPIDLGERLRSIATRRPRERLIESRWHRY